MKFTKHITQQPFIVATGLAALVHSTWSLGTLFSGTEPAQFSIAWFGWLIPALLIAFALDVGQIVTSGEIRAGARTRAKYLTFLVFACATYYLQWLYMAHHMPTVELAPGVRESWGPAAGLLRDCALWFIPALLPLSTALYTFSYEKQAPSQPVANSAKVHDAVLTVERSTEPIEPQAEQLSAPVQPALPMVVESSVPADLLFVCADCGYTNTYKTALGLQRGKAAHSRHCVGAEVQS